MVNNPGALAIRSQSVGRLPGPARGAWGRSGTRWVGAAFAGVLGSLALSAGPARSMETDPPGSAGHALVYHDSLGAVLLVNAGLDSLEAVPIGKAQAEGFWGLQHVARITLLGEGSAYLPRAATAPRSTGWRLPARVRLPRGRPAPSGPSHRPRRLRAPWPAGLLDPVGRSNRPGLRR